MKLNGRWFPQIVDRDSGNLYPIYRYIYTQLWCLLLNQLAGDLGCRVALFLILMGFLWFFSCCMLFPTFLEEKFRGGGVKNGLEKHYLLMSCL